MAAVQFRYPMPNHHQGRRGSKPNALQNIQSNVVTTAQPRKAVAPVDQNVLLTTKPTEPEVQRVGPSLLLLPDVELVAVMDKTSFTELAGIVVPSKREAMLDCRGMTDTGRFTRLVELAEKAIVKRLWKLAAARNVTGKVDMDMVGNIIGVMGRFASNNKVCVAGCAALEASGVLGGHEAAQSFVDANGAALVVSIMRAHQENAPAQEYGTWILGSLGYLGYSETLEFLGAVEAILMAIKSHSGNSKVVRNGARALDGLSQASSDLTLGDGRVEGLCGILRDHRDDAGAVKLACGAIATILRVSGDRAVEMNNAVDVARASLVAMQGHMDDAELVHASLMMLGTVLWAKRTDMGELSTLQTQITKMAEAGFKKHMNHAKVKQAVAWLQSLCSRGTNGLVIGSAQR